MEGEGIELEVDGVVIIDCSGSDGGDDDEDEVELINEVVDVDC